MSNTLLFLWPGRIDNLDSLFYYAPGESYLTYARTNFKPLFIEDVLRNMTTERRTKAKETCGDNKECIFDYAVTGTLILIFTFLTNHFKQRVNIIMCAHVVDANL